MISIIVAVSEDLGIGKDNELLWHIPEDLKRFKKMTTGNVVVMGKKTWESLPRKPLPGRMNVVLTDDQSDVFENSVTAYSLEDALTKCGTGREIFVIGGGSVYRQFMSIADRLYITHVHKTAPADIYFPEIDPALWEAIDKKDYISGGDERIPYTFTVYERKDCDLIPDDSLTGSADS